jgi:hypothetical protein
MSNAQITKIVSLVLIVSGLGLLYWGYDLSNSLGGQLSKTFAGSQSDDAMLAYISGAVSLVVGIYLSRK